MRQGQQARRGQVLVVRTDPINGSAAAHDAVRRAARARLSGSNAATTAPTPISATLLPAPGYYRALRRLLAIPAVLPATAGGTTRSASARVCRPLGPGCSSAQVC